jgi:hypothetical protein
LKFGRHEQQRERLRAALGTGDRLPRFGRGERRQHLIEELIGAANLDHIALVGGNTKMVRPEPDQPLDKADLGAERGVETRCGFERNLLGTPNRSG